MIQIPLFPPLPSAEWWTGPREVDGVWLWRIRVGPLSGAVGKGKTAEAARAEAEEIVAGMRKGEVG